jgi:hypothetical protein
VPHKDVEPLLQDCLGELNGPLDDPDADDAHSGSLTAFAFARAFRIEQGGATTLLATS